MTWEPIALGLFIAAGGGVLVPAAALMLHREYNRRIARQPAATQFENIEEKLAEARKDLEEAKAKIADVEQEVKRKTAEVTALEVRCEHAVAEAAEAAARKVQIEDDLLQLEPKRIELMDIERQLASAQEGLADVTQRKVEAESKIEQYLRFRERLKGELQELTEKLNQANALAEQLPGLQAELQTLQFRLDSTHQEIERTLAALADRQHELAQVEGRRDSLHTEVRGLEQRRGDLGAEITELTEKVNRVKVIAEQLPALQAELQTLQSRLETKNQEIERAAARLADTQRELAQIEGRRDALHTEVRGLEQRRGELEGIIDNLDARVRKAGKLEDDAEQQALADLTRLPPCLKEAGLTQGRGPVTEEEALADLQRYLEKLGLRFPRRTLYAFHTCLKINDLSPLTVLAGISGTGKSELPRRYAEGMGLHFLQMAVQPRWDSPQDLFGFYNYLEHRYIATDLARALVHLDYHNHSDLAGPWQNRMLLVLLDEMNLARVEYYFSEFLSRLEIRKSVVARDSTKRLDAEIQLDIGGREKPFNLFVDRNVLFVGTMNEDESTQTLSDKVIDRANVLRFGRPLELAERQPNQSARIGGAYLSRQTWDDWTRTVDALDTHDRERLCGWISDLNKVMQALERPFGHRINQAILLYCANYPDQGPHRLSHAFSDQLEQRILPKLRGVETTEFRDPLGQLQTLIEKKVGDDVLAKAIEEGRKKPLFSLQGLNRPD
ncbi:hypothetical protein [uncultured Lamprocystis sp.]|jgi:predicted  nucleic acid-binding Zn-ribbon protein|uniref:hypothetical protein n=1 Tax=uncultured Lamprocystis sp. TaxID=543132 RepID=UPI0025E99DC5|nr:hypothetical protein [uncultured Lamprocystis sp.]